MLRTPTHAILVASNASTTVIPRSTLVDVQLVPDSDVATVLFDPLSDLFIGTTAPEIVAADNYRHPEEV